MSKSIYIEPSTSKGWYTPRTSTKSKSGVVFQIRYTSLVDMIYSEYNIREDEYIDRLELTPDGIRIYVEKHES